MPRKLSFSGFFMCFFVFVCKLCELWNHAVIIKSIHAKQLLNISFARSPVELLRFLSELSKKVNSTSSIQIHRNGSWPDYVSGRTDRTILHYHWFRIFIIVSYWSFLYIHIYFYSNRSSFALQTWYVSWIPEINFNLWVKKPIHNNVLSILPK